MARFLVEPPENLPVTREQVKRHLRLETGDEDDYVDELAAMAVAQIESGTGLSLIDRTWRLFFDDWPPGRVFDYPVGPVSAVLGVALFRPDGSQLALSSDQWVSDTLSQPARLLVADTPQTRIALRVFNAIRIDVACGYGSTGADVPHTLIRAILVLCAHWYERRAMLGDSPQADWPAGLSALLAPYRRMRL